MTTEERIKTINAFATNRDLAELQKLNDREVYKQNLIKSIKELGGRIKEMSKVAIALSDAQIPLGEPQYEVGNYLPFFITDSWSHRIGFFCYQKMVEVSRKEWAGRGYEKPTAFGICGGGACGCSLEIDFDGNIIKGADEVRKMEKVIERFNEIEKGFYDYVDNLSKVA